MSALMRADSHVCVPVHLCVRVCVQGMEVLLSDRKHDLLTAGVASIQKLMDKQVRPQ